MKKIVTFSILLLKIQVLSAQSILSGQVVDKDGMGLPGANVYLEGTYDGTATNEEGFYHFTTEETGEQQLIITSIGYENNTIAINLSNNKITQDVILKAKTSIIEGVVISAGAFEASDQGKSVIMKPMDIVTTAGATADLASVMNTLPGAQTVAENGRLYVRGGNSNELNVFIDGAYVPEAFGRSASNIPSRFRFSPFLFKGTFFSTGGYSAEYGQALSSVLVLETGDLPQRNQTDISLMSVGADINQTIKWDKSSLYAQFQYTDLSLYFKAVPQRYDYKKAPQEIGGTIHFKSDMNGKGLLKFYSNYQGSDLIISQPYFLDVRQNEWVNLQTDYFYNSLTLDYQLKDNLQLKSGISGTYNEELSETGDFRSINENGYLHGKLLLDFYLNDYFFLKTGVELFHSNLSNNAHFSENYNSEKSYSDNLSSFFCETDLHITEDLLLRAGVRYENSAYLDKSNLAPRISLAYKLSSKSQVSTAYGVFYQKPEKEYLFHLKRLNFTAAEHFIFNYQYKSKGKVIRAEAYHKSYQDLIKYHSDGFQSYSEISNEGNGFANGLDLFWRDESSFNNIDYWISYSFINTSRNENHFPGSFTPGYVSSHNFSLVYKHFIPLLRTQVGCTYHFSSSRTYDNPNTEQFMDGSIPAYHDVSVNLSYLLKQHIIIHASVTNVLGLKRDFGRQYSVIPDQENFFHSIPIKQEANHFVFLGCFITLSKDKNANQLNNL